MFGDGSYFSNIFLISVSAQRMASRGLDCLVTRRNSRAGSMFLLNFQMPRLRGTPTV